MPVPDRLVPDLALPPYSYVPGLWPHPFTDPAGHGLKVPAPATLDSSGRGCLAYLAGIDLFNLGYYWEAHEAWEQLWHAAGRRGLLADFFKALIQLAVVGVKVRERRLDGARSHASRAAELLRALEAVKRVWWGLDVAELARQAKEAISLSAMPSGREQEPLAVKRVFDWYLLPQFESSPSGPRS